MKDKVFTYLLTVPKGKVTTYGEIARHIGNKNLARAVGNILHNNPDGERFPCYRVVNSKGKLSQNFAFGGIFAQRKKLESDGIDVVDFTVDLNKYKFED